MSEVLEVACLHQDNSRNRASGTVVVEETAASRVDKDNTQCLAWDKAWVDPPLEMGLEL